MNSDQLQLQLLHSSVAQSIGSGILVLATIALVWATFRLVSATHALAKVGEAQWKSTVKPILLLQLNDGVLEQHSAATWTVKNGCAVELGEVTVEISTCALSLDANGTYLTDASPPVKVQSQDVGVLAKAATGVSSEYWAHAQSALTAANKIEIPGATVVAGLLFTLSYSHSVTEQRFTYSKRYQITDIGNFRAQVRELNKTVPQVVE